MDTNKYDELDLRVRERRGANGKKKEFGIQCSGLQEEEGRYSYPPAHLTPETVSSLGLLFRTSALPSVQFSVQPQLVLKAPVFQSTPSHDAALYCSTHCTMPRPFYYYR